MFLLSSYAMKFPMKKSKKVVKEVVLFKSHQGKFCIDLYKDLNDTKKQEKQKSRVKYFQAKGIENKA